MKKFVLFDMIEWIMRDYGFTASEGIKLEKGLDKLVVEATNAWSAQGYPNEYFNASSFIELSKNRFFEADIDYNPEARKFQLTNHRIITREEYEDAQKIRLTPYYRKGNKVYYTRSDGGKSIKVEYKTEHEALVERYNKKGLLMSLTPHPK